MEVSALARGSLRHRGLCVLGNLGCGGRAPPRTTSPLRRDVSSVISLRRPLEARALIRNSQPGGLTPRISSGASSLTMGMGSSPRWPPPTLHDDTRIYSRASPPRYETSFESQESVPQYADGLNRPTHPTTPTTSVEPSVLIGLLRACHIL